MNNVQIYSNFKIIIICIDLNNLKQNESSTRNEKIYEGLKTDMHSCHFMIAIQINLKVMMLVK